MLADLAPADGPGQVAWPVSRPAYHPRCYRLPPHKPLPSREALVLWIGLQPLWQVADIWPLRPADNRPNPCGTQFPHPKTRAAILRQAEPFDCHPKAAPTRLFACGGPTRSIPSPVTMGKCAAFAGGGLPFPGFFIAHGRGLFSCRALDNIERLTAFPRQQSNMIKQIIRAWPGPWIAVP
jgi:hypothetical protein